MVECEPEDAVTAGDQFVVAFGVLGQLHLCAVPLEAVGLEQDAGARIAEV